jgi:regulatory protein
VPTVTALRDDGAGRVAVELDGLPWRTVTVDVAARAGLSKGRALDRPALRTLRRELRRAEALAVAGRALRDRDLSSARLAARLQRAAIGPATVRSCLGALEEAGLVDDDRFARDRATLLAGRGHGDAAIRHDLASQGIPLEAVEAALAGLESELVRARRVVERRGRGLRTARYLAGKGFAEEACETGLDPRFAAET